MGINSTAYLYYGLNLVSHDEDGEQHPFWSGDHDEGEWKAPEGFVILDYGHYEDPDAHRGVLSHPSIPEFQGDCWEPGSVGDRDLDVQAYHPDAYEALGALLDENELWDDASLGWHLVVSTG